MGVTRSNMWRFEFGSSCKTISHMWLMVYGVALKELNNYNFRIEACFFSEKYFIKLNVFYRVNAVSDQFWDCRSWEVVRIIEVWKIRQLGNNHFAAKKKEKTAWKIANFVASRFQSASNNIRLYFSQIHALCEKREWRLFSWATKVAKSKGGNPHRPRTMGVVIYPTDDVGYGGRSYCPVFNTVTYSCSRTVLCRLPRRQRRVYH